MNTPLADVPTQSSSRRLGRWPSVLGGGFLAGIGAAFAMLLVMSLLRRLFGVPSVAELIGDRFIPTLSLDQFFKLIDRFGGGNGIKRVGISSVLVGQLVVGTLAGVVYAAFVERGRRVGAAQGWRFGVSRRGWLFVAILVSVAWIASITLLWPVLGTSYRGLPPTRAAFFTAIGILLAYTTFGVVLPTFYRLMTQRESTAAPDDDGVLVGRRTVLVAGAGAGLALASGGLIRNMYDRSTLHYDGTRYLGENLEPITPNAQFYTVTKNILDPDIAQSVWRLELRGMLERPRSYSLSDLTDLDAIEQETTLSCISNGVGDGLISNAIWTGVPLQQLLEVAGVREGVVDVALQAADNYIDTISIEKALDPTTFVAWRMNGEEIPKRHGYPVRILVPGRFGEKSVKWVTRITLLDHAEKGFYARQGWGPTFVTQTLARFDSPRNRSSVQLGGESVGLKGIAFAGDRGIERVEVSPDDGETWIEANLDYQSARIAWVMWSLDWQPESDGEHKLVVRAVDGTGETQTERRRGIVPDGATGWHRLTLNVTA